MINGHHENKKASNFNFFLAGEGEVTWLGVSSFLY